MSKQGKAKLNKAVEGTPHPPPPTSGSHMMDTKPGGVTPRKKKAKK